MAKDRAIEDKLKEMEKRVICGLLASIGALMTACMGDGSNSINYHRVGVIRENPMRCIYTTDDKGNIYVVSSADFEQRTELKDGDCCEVDFKTNFKDELASGVYDADIFNYDSVAVWPMRQTLTDTSKTLVKERVVSLNIAKSIYLEGRFFLQTQHAIHQADQKDIFDLSYNPEQKVEVDEDGNRIYNLYLRVSQEGGTGDSISWIKTTAFTIDDFLDKAKAAESAEGKNTVNIKINYVTGFNEDSTACEWGATEMFTLRVTN